jgi:hypothetical protein
MTSKERLRQAFLKKVEKYKEENDKVETKKTPLTQQERMR